MGIFKGLGEVLISPIKITTKTVDKVFNEEWGGLDICTLGISKVAKSIGDTAKEIDEGFTEK